MSKIIDLTHTLSSEIPGWDLGCKFELETTVDYKDCTPPNLFRVQKINMLAQMGTHMDAPLHVIPGGTSIDHIPVDQVAGEGVILDVHKAGPEPITARDLEKGNLRVQEGDLVFLWTGWGDKFSTPEYDPHPYLSEEAAGYLVEKKVKVVGLDVLTPDLPAPFRKEDYRGVVHETLLGNGVLIIENLGHLDEVAGKRLWICAAPMKVRDGDAGFVRVLAFEKVPGIFPS